MTNNEKKLIGLLETIKDKMEYYCDDNVVFRKGSALHYMISKTIKEVSQDPQ